MSARPLDLRRLRRFPRLLRCLHHHWPVPQKFLAPRQLPAAPPLAPSSPPLSGPASPGSCSPGPALDLHPSLGVRAGPASSGISSAGPALTKRYPTQSRSARSASLWPVHACISFILLPLLIPALFSQLTLPPVHPAVHLTPGVPAFLHRSRPSPYGLSKLFRGLVLGIGDPCFLELAAL